MLLIGTRSNFEYSSPAMERLPGKELPYIAAILLMKQAA